MKLLHKSIFGRIEIDSLNGIYSQHLKDKRILWDQVVAIIKYIKPGWIRQKHFIGFAYQDKKGAVYQGELLATADKFKCLYFCEKIVDYLKKEHRAKGGKMWCARILNENGAIQDNFTMIASYIVCRMIADKMKVNWFEHTDDEEVEAVLTFFKYHFIKDGTESLQIENAINDTRFHIMRDGSVNLFGSSGYRLLDDARIKIAADMKQSGTIEK